MSNHIHLTGRVNRKESLSECFQVVHSRFAAAVNRRMKRRGQVIMERFKSPRIQSDQAQLRVMVYNDMNPIRANMVKRPEKYRWSSYWYYAHGQADPLITPAGAYLELGATQAARQVKYREMVLGIVEAEATSGKMSHENFSTACFIGDPKWVATRHRALQTLMAARRQAAIKRYRERFGRVRTT